MVLPIKDVKSTYQQGGSSCKSLEKFCHPISIISPISSLAGTLAPQASHDNTMAMLPNVLAYSRTTTPKEDKDTVVVLADFENVVQQGNHACTKSRHQQTGSPAGHHQRFKPTTLFTITANLSAQYTRIKACDFSLKSNKDWLAPGCIH